MKLHIKVKPGSKKDEIVREPDGSFKIKIRAQPVAGKANKYLLEYLAAVLNMPKSSLTLLKGSANSFKTIDIQAPEKEIHQKLALAATA